MAIDDLDDLDDEDELEDLDGDEGLEDIDLDDQADDDEDLDDRPGLVALGKALDESHDALTETLERAESLEAERDGLRAENDTLKAELALREAKRKPTIAETVARDFEATGRDAAQPFRI